MKKVLAMVLAAVLICSMLAGCGSKKSNEVKIGVYEPQSGDNGAGGKQEILGMQYANSVAPTVDIGGKTYNVKLEIVDNESSNDKAVSAASQLISKGVSVVLGSYGSGVSIAASDTFKNAGVPAIGVTCTNPAVTAGNTHYFRVCFLDPFQGTVLANYAFQKLGVKKAYCLSKLGDDYSGGLVGYFSDAFQKLGGEVVKAEFPDGNSDFTSYITSAMNEGCGVFFSPTSTEAAQLIIKQAASQNMTMPLLAGDTWDSNVILDAVKGTKVNVTVTTFYSDGTDPTFEAGIKKWISGNATNLKNNGGDDTLAAVSVMGYDAYMAALQAIKDAGSTDPKAVMAALPKLSYDGVTGHIEFDQNGDAKVKTAFVKTADATTGAWVGGGSVTINQ